MTATIIDANDLDALRRVGEDLRDGATVIAQTDTNYGVFASPFSKSACERLYAMKKRDGAKPLTLFLSTPADWVTWAHAPQGIDMDRLVSAFWPGPLNVILEKKPVVPEWVTSGQSTVSVVHNLSAPINLLSIFSGLPLAATSANISGTVSTGLVDFDLALEHLGRDTDYIVRSGQVPESTMSSTIITLVGTPTVVRQGDLSAEALRRVVPTLV
ncbi:MULTISPECIES: L-threonylcarbamoyladenylate synthase [unclassified Rathayibacter]|uniref:L-threonylcarbamoyladenylate synthase n=1 Tax=unclassified Rathayibacter TaxID=2609250 RepID=UPI00188B62EE|nr:MULTISPECIES: L-threonylcarbamoyladenylate synthase [unclassified Rathayibacter]MBF4461995.1 L-threonylcarbamoyladenylate synthase [Rathayibacter sp. VKM Ac-2879]MBF4503962.1 L-threonylcarbamoyladenylate synthase [Rathayibacter sp. VKM Ac-2878]